MNSSGVCAANSRVNGRRTTTSTPASSRRVSFSSGSLRNLSSTPGASTRRGCGSKVRDRKSTRLNSSHSQISYAVFCLKKKKKIHKNNLKSKRLNNNHNQISNTSFCSKKTQHIH